MGLKHTHTHTHTHIYIYIYIILEPITTKNKGIRKKEVSYPQYFHNKL